MTAISPEELADAQAMLNGVGLGVIDTRILAQVLTDNPSIYGTAVAWGWDDTEVRDFLSLAVGCFLLGVDEGECSRRIRESESDFDEAVREAHARWVADNPRESSRTVFDAIRAGEAFEFVRGEADR